MTLALVALGHLLPVGAIWLAFRLPRYPGETTKYVKLHVPQVVGGAVTLSSDHRGLV